MMELHKGEQLLGIEPLPAVGVEGPIAGRCVARLLVHLSNEHIQSTVTETTEWSVKPQKLLTLLDDKDRDVR